MTFIKERGRGNRHIQISWCNARQQTDVEIMECWGGNLLRQDRERIDKLIETAGGVVGKNQENIMTQCERRILKKMKLILKDKTHPLNMLYRKQLSERIDQYRVPKTRTNSHLNSFFPKTIVLYNEEVKRITKS